MEDTVLQPSVDSIGCDLILPKTYKQHLPPTNKQACALASPGITLAPRARSHSPHARRRNTAMDAMMAMMAKAMTMVVLAKGCGHMTYAGIRCRECSKCHKCDACGEEAPEEMEDTVSSFMSENGLSGPTSWAPTAPAPAGKKQ